MLQDLACTAVYVNDMETAATFYRDVLGMPLDNTRRGWIQFQSGGAALVLFPASESTNTVPGHAASKGDGVRIMFRVDNLDRVCQELATKNVRFLAQPTATEFGKKATIYDPEDNVIDLVEWNVGASAQTVSDQTRVNDVIQKSPEAMEVLEEHGIRICGGCIVLLNSSVRETAEYSGLSAVETSELVEELNDKLSSQVASSA